MSFIKKHYYFYDFFKINTNIPPFYDSIKNKSSQSVLFDSFSHNGITKHAICKVNHIPNYLHLDYSNEYNLSIKSLNRDVGYAIHLDGFNDVDTYVNRQFKKGRTIRKYVKRLETSFNITYERYYGDIPQNVYDELLNYLFKMVKRRFSQLNKVNQQIIGNRWQKTLEETRLLIKKKKASLFVIYDDNKPIVISIGHHWGNVFYYVMCSFDIDYSKFGLGHINFYKQVEWCIDNDYKIFDAGPGEYYYKKRWSNTTFSLLQHIVYRKDNFSDRLIANVEMLLTIIKKHLFSESVKTYLKSIKKVFKKDRHKHLTYKTNYINEQNLNLEDYDEIDPNTDDYIFLRKILFDYLYSKIEHKESVSVFNNIADKNMYIFKGERSIMQCKILSPETND